MIWKIRAHTCTQTDQQTAIPSQCRLQRWRRWFEKVSRLVAAAERGGSWGVEGRTGWEGRSVFIWGRGLRTSFNSTLLWKLQLPLSRLAPRPHPSASAVCHTNYTSWPRTLEESRRASCFETPLKPGDACLSMCAPVRLICKTFYMHKKGTLKKFGKDKKPMRPDFNICLSLHNQDYSKIYQEAGQAGEGVLTGMGGGWMDDGRVEWRSEGRNS